MATAQPNVAPVIEVHGLRTQFGAQVIHDGLDFAVNPGEVMGIVGGSGTGKSVLLRAIIGLLKPAAGRVVVLGQDMAALKPAQKRAMQQRWGVLFQDGALFSSLTVRQNIEVPLREHTRLPARLRREIADLKNVGGREAGASTAALFLGHFVEKGDKRWAHIDIAGPAFLDKKNGMYAAGGTGQMVRAISSWIDGLGA